MAIKAFKNQSGFTILELLVVIAVIGLLAAIIVGMTSQARMRARDVKRISEMSQIQKALHLYRLDHGTYPPHLTTRGGDFIDSSDYTGSEQEEDGVQPKPVNVSGEWAALAADLAPYIALPVDPINNARLSDGPNNYSYAYRYVSGEDDYDLFTKLEDPHSQYRSDKKHYRIHSSFANSNNTKTWDGEYSWIENFGAAIYADH